MDETPKIVEKLTEQRLIEEATKKQKREFQRHTNNLRQNTSWCPKKREVYKQLTKSAEWKQKKIEQ